MSYYHFYSVYDAGYDCQSTDSIAYFDHYPSIEELKAQLQARFNRLSDNAIDKLHKHSDLIVDSCLAYTIESISILGATC